MCYDNYLLALLFFLLAIAVLLYGSLLYQKKHNAVLCLIGLGILASFPLFGNYLVRGGDICFHFARINGIYEGLRTGQFPVRINPVQLEGYGYISGAMYPQLFLYFPAFLKFFHISTLLGTKLLILGANLATALFSYYAVRGVCHSGKIALRAAALYILSPYRLINFYTRGALGEGLAMVFLPLVLWGTYEILWNRREKWWILALGMTGVLGSHILSLELYTVLVFGEMVVWVFSKKKNQVWKRMLAMGKAVLYTVCLNLYFIGPFLRFSQENPRCFQIWCRPELSTLDLVRAFEPLAKWADGYAALGEQGSMSVTLGSAALAGICLFAAFVLGNGDKGEQETIRQGKHYLVLGSLFLAASLWVTPWESLLRIEWLESILQAIQFPWRMLGVSAMLFGVVTAIAVTEWERALGRALHLWPLVLCGLVFECGSYYSHMSYYAETIGKIEAEAENHTDDLYLCKNSMPFGFYDTHFSHITCNLEEHIEWMNAARSEANVMCKEPETVAWTNYRREGLHISVDVFVEQAVGECVAASFPLHHYPGFRVLIDGEEAESYSFMSMVTCGITPGEHHIDVDWVGIPFFRFCDIITLCSIIGFILWQKKSLSLYLQAISGIMIKK